ncbi:MAG: dipeptide epimerase [Rhodospirillaceae bacterium]|nr:dipeptide epimerase [Rhodospirillaceae bacterium]
MKLDVAAECFGLARAFAISRGAKTEARVLTVCVEADGVRGYGECVPYPRYGETAASVTAEIEALPLPLDRARLQDLLPAGAARNAVDCALWDLEAKTAGRRVWEIAGLPEPGPVVTAYTLSLDEPREMAAAAARNAHRPLLKVKLGGAGDRERLEAVRSGAPEARIVVDANEGWSAETFGELMPFLARLGVEMVEQPLPAGADGPLRGMDRLLPVCADESCHDRASLGGLAGKYDMVNIKLDKTGGLTEALALKRAARAQGYGVMVGCMVGSSLAMAPAVLVAQDADVTDLDGPLLLAEDRAVPLRYDEAGVHPPAAGLWG